MKAPITVLAGICLCALSLACSFTGKIAEAKADGGSRGQKVRALASSLGSPARQDWRLGAPVSFKNLTVFPVHSDESTASVELITLDEGLRSGKVKITEMDADGRSRTINPRHGDSAEVNRLALTNNSGKALVLIAGEMILGGKQDRIVGHDCIFESTNTPVPLDVFCVEHGRWSGAFAFGRSASGGGLGVGSGAGPGARVAPRTCSPAARGR